MTTDELLQRWNDGSITADELHELTAKLAEPKHQSALLDDWLLESSLPDRLPGASVAGLRESETTRSVERMDSGRAKHWPRWLSWRPLAAAAAGLALGMFCTSVVFAYVGPSLGKAMLLLQESFESGPAPLVIGVPIEPGKWSGDFMEVVGEQQGVKPERGTKMLHLLRADFEGKAGVEGNYFADVYRLIDVRPHQREFADGGAVVQLSAAFNAFAFPAEEAFGASVEVHALSAATAVDGSRLSEWSIESESLAMARNHRLKLDRAPGTWQRLGTELRLPPDTEYLLIRISVDHSNPSQRRVSFDGHYVDDVRLTLARRAPLP